MPLETINLSISRSDHEGRSKADDSSGGTSSSGKDSGFQATPEELNAIREKIKDPVFAKLMHEYMESLSDPETLREEEAYLEQAEREAKESGDFSFEFIFPRPGFVVELLNPTSRRISAVDMKKIMPTSSGTATTVKDVHTFINMCSSEKVPVYREEPTGDRMGSNWHVPVSVSQKRIESFSRATKGKKEVDGRTSEGENNKATDANGSWCYVYDAVFHPQTLSLADRSNRFLCFLVEIAVEHINSGYHESNGFEFTRLPSTVATVVGTLKNQTIRTKDKKGASLFEVDRGAPVLTRPTTNLPQGAGAGPDFSAVTPAPSSSEHHGEAPVREQRADAAGSEGPPKRKAVTDPQAVLPPHRILHRGRIDLTDAWSWRVVDKRIGVPEELVVKLTFDGVHHASGLDISITEDGGAVRIDKTATQNHYEGLLVLPFTVRETPVSARFDRVTHVLSLVLGVIPPVLSEESAAAAEEVRQRYVAVGKPDAPSSVAHDDHNEAAGISADGKTSGVAVADTRPASGEAMKHSCGDSDGTPSVGPSPGSTVVASESTSVNTPATVAVSARIGTGTTECREGTAPDGKDGGAASDETITDIEPTPAGLHPPPPPLSPSTDADPVGDPATVPEGHSNVFRHFENTSRAQEALAKILEARRAREAAASSATEAARAADDKAAATGSAESVAGVGEGEGMRARREVSADPESEAAALAAQQDAWVHKLQEQVAAAAAKEDEEAEAAALKVQRDAQRSKRRLEKLMELEEMEKRMLERAKAIPLKNRHIFSID
ncbi:unnamed protein product [Phytomonas sp. EM1]|nr:unnamed protein product [Phytomonas sp. EM1]|eukprot:CCW64937.1 unnamed protein product [Phytomonas sp. isolate EM1]